MSSFLTKILAPIQPRVGRSAGSKTRPSRDLPFKLNVKSASNWLKNLPLDSNRTWQLIISAIQSLNENRCDPSTRLNILEILRPVVVILSKKLENYTSKSDAPAAKKRKIAKLSVKFNLGIAVGYRLVSTSNTFGSDFTQDEQARIIYRAMRFYGLSLLLTCQMYESCPSKIWGELNRLYRIAETRGFTNTVIDKSEHRHDFHTSIDALFKVIVLFTIINPYRFTRQEMTDIFGLLEQTSDNVHLSRNKFEQGYLASVFVDLQSNHPPALVGRSPHNDNNRYFFTWKFEHYLTHVDGKQASWRDLSTYGAKLIPRLGDFSGLALSGERKRKQLFQGFDLIYSFLRTSQAQLGVVQEQKPQHQDWLTIPDFGLMPLEDDNNAPNGKQTLQQASGLDIQTPSASNNGNIQDQSSSELESVDCFVARTNVYGFYIIETHTILEVGQLIAFSSYEEPTQIASVRGEQTTSRKEQLQYVVEVLASGARPVLASFKSDPGVKLMLVDNVSKEIQGSSILLPPVRYRCGTVFAEQNAQNNSKYQITQLREVNNMFCQYSIEKGTQ